MNDKNEESPRKKQFHYTLLILVIALVLIIIFLQTGWVQILKFNVDQMPENIVKPSILTQCKEKLAEYEALKKHLGIVKIGEFPENISISDLNLYNDLQEEYEEMDCNLVLYPEDYG